MQNDFPDLEFRNVNLSFDDTPALANISFKVDRGEMIFLSGASGSGKSVLLRLAIGLLKPDDGQIFVKGQEVDNLDEPALLAVRGGLMGMVFQEASLFPAMSVSETVAYRHATHGGDDD